MAPKLPLPRGWKRRIPSSVLHIRAFGHFRLQPNAPQNMPTGSLFGLFVSVVSESLLTVALSSLGHNSPQRAGMTTGRGASSRGAGAVSGSSGPPQESVVAGLTESVN